jgi:hypothetical protein
MREKYYWLVADKPSEQGDAGDGRAERRSKARAIASPPLNA